jgi:two-component system NarL family sensor kinase
VRRVASSDADRLTAFLRLLAAPVVMIGETVSSAAPDRGTTVIALAAALAVYAAAVLVLVWRPTRPTALDFALPVIDTGFAVALGLASGGVFSLLFLVFLFAPATTAFQLRPRLTLAVTVLSVGAYLVHALAHPNSSREGAVALAFSRALYLAWIGAVLVGLSTLLARRERRLADLLQSRKRLVQETLHADERARARLAGDLHDGVLQSLLAVRYSVEEAADRDPALQPSVEALTEIAAEMRGVIGELHPRVLEHVGLEAALGSIVRRAAERAPAVVFRLHVDGAGADRGDRDAELFRSAQELVGNAVAHADASAVDVTLHRGGDWDELVVADDGKGFDTAVLADRLREGHIGLLALQERIEGVGGTVTVDPAPEYGSTITVRVPATAAGPAVPGSSSAADRPSG